MSKDSSESGILHEIGHTLSTSSDSSLSSDELSSASVHPTALHKARGHKDDLSSSSLSLSEEVDFGGQMSSQNDFEMQYTSFIDQARKSNKIDASLVQKAKDLYVKAASFQDHEYIKKHKLNYIENAIRVEQGEYAVDKLDESKGIGTYNINQCIVICAYNEEKKLYGLAHVDSHTETDSLEAFFKEVDPDNQNKLQIKLFGGGGEAAGINDPKANYQKVISFIHSLNKGYPTEDHTLDKFDKEKYSTITFLPDNTIKEKTLAGGCINEERALHNLQSFKRSGGYQGSYKLLSASPQEASSIAVDSQALKKISELKFNPSSYLNERLTEENIDTDHYYEFDIALYEIISKYDDAVKELFISGDKLKILYEQDESKIEEFHKIIAKTPLYIGKDLKQKNLLITNFLNKEASKYQNAAEFLQNIDQALQNEEFSKIKKDMNINSSKINIHHAVKIVKNSFDTSLDEQKFYENLKVILKPNMSDKEFNNMSSDIENKKYAAEIEVSDFYEALRETSPLLATHYFLHSFSYNNKFNVKDVTTASSKLLGEAIESIEDKVIKNHNDNIDRSYKIDQEAILNLSFDNDNNLLKRNDFTDLLDKILKDNEVKRPIHLKIMREFSPDQKCLNDQIEILKKSNNLTDQVKENLSNQIKEGLISIYNKELKSKYWSQNNLKQRKIYGDMEREELIQVIFSEKQALIEKLTVEFNELTIVKELTKPSILNNESYLARPKSPTEIAESMRNKFESTIDLSHSSSQISAPPPHSIQIEESKEGRG